MRILEKFPTPAEIVGMSVSEMVTKVLDVSDPDTNIPPECHEESKRFMIGAATFFAVHLKNQANIIQSVKKEIGLAPLTD